MSKSLVEFRRRRRRCRSSAVTGNVGLTVLLLTTFAAIYRNSIFDGEASAVAVVEAMAVPHIDQDHPYHPGGEEAVADGNDHRNWHLVDDIYDYVGSGLPRHRRSSSGEIYPRSGGRVFLRDWLNRNSKLQQQNSNTMNIDDDDDDDTGTGNRPSSVWIRKQFYRPQKFKKVGSTCYVHAGLTTNCDYQDLIGAAQKARYWSRANGPGR